MSQADLEGMPAALSSRAPDPASYRAALVVACLSLGVFLALVPFAGVALAAVPLFVPVNQMVLVVNDLITAVLLFGHMHLARSRALVVLAAGYLYSALMAVLHLLSFPGAFAPHGLLGGGPQVTAYLYVFWHAGFPLFVVAYVLLRRRGVVLAWSWQRACTAAGIGVALLVALVGAGTIVFSDAFPSVMRDGLHYSAAFSAVRYGVWMVTGAAVLAVWFARPRSVLNLWLAVALGAWFLEIGLVAIFNAGRYDIGFYAGRIYALLSSCFVLVSLLVEQVRLHGQLLAARDEARSEAALREAETRFRLMMDAIPQLAWVARPDGSMEWCNRPWYEYTGMSPAQAARWPWREVLEPASLAAFETLWLHSRSTGEPLETTMTLRGADGQARKFLTRAVPLRDANGHIVQWLGTSTDVDAQSALEDALREADARKDEFLATLSHELRNPLAPIRTSVEIIGRSSTLPDVAQKAQQILDRQSRHLVRLVDDLLEVSRITSGKLMLRKERIPVARCVRDALEAVRPAAEAARLELRAELAQESPWIEADATRITQCVSNLLNNAVKFTPPGGRITVTLDEHEGHARLRVADTGIGIAPEDRDGIFAMFAQLTPGLHRTNGGLGIGLALARALVEMHCGSLEVESEGAGKGSVFTLALPVVPAPDAAARPGIAATPAPGSVRRILVVDDNVDAAATLRAALELCGHEVREAHDGPSCLAIAREFHPDLVLLDLGMPHMSGLEVAPRLRALENGAHMRIVALTGWGADRDRALTRQSGFDLHLTKPVDMARIESVAQAADLVPPRGTVLH